MPTMVCVPSGEGMIMSNSYRINEFGNIPRVCMREYMSSCVCTLINVNNRWWYRHEMLYVCMYFIVEKNF